MLTARSPEGVVTVSVALFAFSTLLGWEYYGEKCLEYLCGGTRSNSDRDPACRSSSSMLMPHSSGPTPGLPRTTDTAGSGRVCG